MLLHRAPGCPQTKTLGKDHFISAVHRAVLSPVPRSVCASAWSGSSAILLFELCIV